MIETYEFDSIIPQGSIQLYIINLTVILYFLCLMDDFTILFIIGQYVFSIFIMILNLTISYYIIKRSYVLSFSNLI